MRKRLIKTIDDNYKDIIKSFQKESLKDCEDLAGNLKAQGCLFGDKPIPCFIKPFFISSEFEDELADTLAHVTNMLEKVVRFYFEHKDLRPVFGLSPAARKLVEVDPGYSRNIMIARPDAFIERGKIRFLEFNCDSPAGAGYADIEEKVIKQTFAMKKLSSHYRWGSMRRLKLLLRALLIAYGEFGGRRKYPHIAIVDWNNVRTQGEFEITRRYFESKGYATCIADPRELKLKRDGLYAGSRRIDLIYRRVIFHELLAKESQVRDFLRAYAHNKVCVVNPLRSRLAANKAIVSLMSKPEFNALFSRHELKVREASIPWTRRLIHAKKEYGGEIDHLKNILVRHKKELVIKPSESYGGKDVRIGKETSLSEWRRIVARVLKHKERWVVQKYIKTPHMEVPVLRGTKVSMVNKKMNINPFVFAGKYAGSMVRLSDESVINVSAGGGLIPAITVKAS